MLDFNTRNVKSDDELVGLLLSESQSEFNKFMITESYEKQDKKRNVIQRSLKAIQEKFFNEEFKTIMETEGDIKNLKGYKDLRKSLDYIGQIVADKESRQRYIELKKCLDNLEKHSRNFKLYFKQNDIVLSLYTTTVSSLIASTADMVLNNFDYEVGTTKLVIISNKATKNFGITFNTVLEFNKMVNEGSLIKLFNQVKNEIQTGSTTDQFLGTAFKKVKDFTNNEVKGSFEGIKSRTVATFKDGSVPTKVALALAISAVGIFVIREAVYYFYYFRNSISTYLESLSNFVEMNATKNQSSNPKIREKQVGIANKLRTVAAKVSSYNTTVERKVKAEIKKEEASAKQSGADNTDLAGDILL